MSDTTPRRRYRLELTIDADDLQTLTDTLDNIAYGLQMLDTDASGDLTDDYDSVLGGSSRGYVLTVKVDRAMTHDGYFEAINAWRAKHGQSPRSDRIAAPPTDTPDRSE